MEICFKVLYLVCFKYDGDLVFSEASLNIDLSLLSNTVIILLFDYILEQWPLT